MLHVQIVESEELRRAVQREAGRLAYVSVRECLTRGKFKTLGRRDFNAMDLAPFIEHEEADEEADATWDMGLTAAAKAPEDAESAKNEAAVAEQAKLAEAMVGWVTQGCGLALGKRRSATFQVQGWIPKGMATVFAMRVTATNNEADEDDGEEDDAAEKSRDDAPTVEYPSPLPPPPLPEVSDSNWTQLGAHYRTFMDLNQHALTVIHHANRVALATQQDGHRHVIKSLGNVTEDLRRQLDHSFGEIRRRDEYIAERTGRFLDIKITAAEMNLDASHKEDPAALKMKSELATNFITELGSLGRMAISSKLGSPAELVELFDLISKDEKLVERLREPDVRTMFREPGATEGLGQFLDLALEQFRAQKRASSPPNADASVPPSGP